MQDSKNISCLLFQLHQFFVYFSEFEQVERRIVSLSKEDFNAFELKVEKYEKELSKFEVNKMSLHL